MRKQPLYSFVCVSLLACGGGSDLSQEYQLAVAGEAEARALATVSPCNGDYQCVAIGLRRLDKLCGEYSWIPHSWASEAGYLPIAASNRLFVHAEQAPELARPPELDCSGVKTVEPQAICVANACELKEP